LRRKLRPLIEKLKRLQDDMVALAQTDLPDLAQVPPERRASATNLLHYVALRRHDVREMQAQLAALGVSSLGRTETHVLDSVRTVIGLLSSLPAALPGAIAGEQTGDGRRILERNTELLLGPEPEGRRVRIMVTMPSEAATDYGLVRDLVAGGMNCMRINCAHDNQESWAGMIQNLRRAERELGRRCVIEMDVAGPKLRTGPIEAGPAVLKCGPKRDEFGHVAAPARIWLTPIGHPERPPAVADACIPVPARWLASLRPGDRVTFEDARQARRCMTIIAAVRGCRWAELTQTAYFVPGLPLVASYKDNRRPDKKACVGNLPRRPQRLQVKRGDLLMLTRSGEPGRQAQYDHNGQLLVPPRIGVSLPEFFECVLPGQPIWFDDGKIGGVVREVDQDCVTVEIRHARVDGDWLGAEKGINIPESSLNTPTLTAEDLQALDFIVKHAGILGYSFVRTEADVRMLQAHLAELGAEKLGILLKIETRDGFENLPSLLLAAMGSHSVGVMIARGDLAVECGYERLAEAQEEILWISEAAHVPVVWATQVLETLTKTGRPTRAEITDAAMGERAECVMLNKGPYVVEAVRTLDDILRRMQAHQDKKRSMLRKLGVAAGYTGAAGQSG